MRPDLQQKGALRDEDSEDLPEPSNLRFLRRLVTLLMATMIVGITAIAGALVFALTAKRDTSPALIGEVALEPGATVVSTAFRGPDALALVVRDADGRETLRVYRLDREAGGSALRAAE